MPSRNTSAKACELARRSPKDTGCASISNFSDILLRLTHTPGAVMRARYVHKHRARPLGCPDGGPANLTTRLRTRALAVTIDPKRHNKAQKRSRRHRRLEVDNREASNRVDRSHSMSKKMDAPSNDRESLTAGYRIAANARF